jgi:hypothetical protein
MTFLLDTSYIHVILIEKTSLNGFASQLVSSIGKAMFNKDFNGIVIEPVNCFAVEGNRFSV